MDIIGYPRHLFHMPSKPSIEEENENDREEDYINLLLEKALT
jgi:hypothetical protein